MLRVKGRTYASIVDQNVQPRFKLHEGLCPLLYAVQVLKIHVQGMKIKLYFAGCFHFSNGLVDTLRRPCSDIDSSAVRSKLERGLIAYTGVAWAWSALQNARVGAGELTSCDNYNIAI